MKQVYFVRHGETAHNRDHLHQPDTAPLTERGRDQAIKSARVIESIEPDRIITSTMTRAVQTGRIIGEKLQMEVEPNVLFMELRRPDHIIDLHHFSLPSIIYMMRWFFVSDETYWRTVDGESRNAFLMRIREAKHYLEALPDDSITVVISHSVFIHFFIEHICNKKRINFFWATLLLLKIKNLDNSSITQMQYTKTAPQDTCAWSIVQYGVDEHLEC